MDEHTQKTTAFPLRRQELIQANKRLGYILNSLSEGILEISDKIIVYANPTAGQLFGLPVSVLLGKYLPDLFHPQDQIQVETLLKSSVVMEIGQNRPLEINNRLVSLKSMGIAQDQDTCVILIKDITEEKRLEKQLRQAQKMEAIGTLAGGIAHDFNNILSAIMGYAEMIAFDVPESKAAHVKIDQIIKASNRAKDLIMQILAFSRQNELKRKPIQMHLVVKEVLKLLRASLPTNIEIRQSISDKSSAIIAEPTQIHQILMNLCTNAHHAIGPSGGVIDVCLTHMVLESDASPFPSDLKPGAYIKLSVSDTGVGMEPALLDRIFDPYFTTKKQGQGTGMGLAVVHGIVKSHGGSIVVRSSLGQGSTFDLYFPEVDADVQSELTIAEPLPEGTERILFVDDEEVLIDIGAQMLTHLGYTVESRTSSIEALEAFRAKPDFYDLVITDMSMPNMTGEALAKELLNIRPQLPILLCTGFSETMTYEKARSVGIQNLLMKPLTMRALAEVVRKTLSSGDAAIDTRRSA